MATREASTACLTTRFRRPRESGDTGLGFLLYSPAHDGGHIKWPPVRAELAINLSRCPRSPGACGYLVVACGSLFGTGLIILDARRSWSLWAWGAALLEVDFWDMPEKLLQLLVLQRSCGRHFRNVPKCRFLSVGLAGKFRCGEPVAGMGRRDSASAFSAAAPRCVASLLACCAGKRFAFPQLRTLAGSNPSACPQESAPSS